MSSTDPQVDRSARKQRQLLDAAERVYHRHGDLGLTVRRLAAEADATSQTIYTYFGSRDAVIDGMYDRIIDDVTMLIDRMDADFAGAGSTADALTTAAATYATYCQRFPARFAMLSAGHGPDGWDPGPMAGQRDRLVALLAKVLTDGNGDDTPARLLLAAWNGLVKARHDRLVESMADGAEVDPAGAAVTRELVGGSLSGAAST